MESRWCCSHCGRLLAVRRGGRLHISFSRGHRYIVSSPATSVCRHCGTLNELKCEREDPARRPEATAVIAKK